MAKHHDFAVYVIYQNLKGSLIQTDHWTQYDEDLSSLADSIR